MPYSPTTYVNDAAPALSAVNLNKAEIGIRDATTKAETAQSTASGAQTTASAAQTAASAAQTTATSKRTQAQVRDDAAAMLTGGTHTNVTATRVGDVINLVGSGAGGGDINGGTPATRTNLIQGRGGTAAAWTSANPVLGAREFGIETDTRKLKVGDGTTVWASLGYMAGNVAASTDLSDTSSIVRTTGVQGIAGEKTFSDQVVIGPPDPINDAHATRKDYVDTEIATRSPTSHGHGLTVYDAAGALLPSRPALRFFGDAVATDDPTANVTKVTVPNTLSGFTFKAALQTLAASSVALQDLTLLSFPVLPLTNYRVYFVVKYQATAAEGFKLGVAFPAGVTSLTSSSGSAWGYDMAGVVQKTNIHLSGANGTYRGLGAVSTSVEGGVFLMVGDAGGTFQLQAAQGVSQTTQPIVVRSSFLEWARV